MLNKDDILQTLRNLQFQYIKSERINPTTICSIFQVDLFMIEIFDYSCEKVSIIKIYRKNKEVLSCNLPNYIHDFEKIIRIGLQLEIEKFNPFEIKITNNKA